MNFLQLQLKVIEKLKERSDPKYWSLSEIKDNINRGQRMLAKDTAARKQTLPLRVADPSAGTYFLPVGVMEPKELRWNGTKLHKTSVEYLDANSGANQNLELVRGEDQAEAYDWQTQTADTPTHWLMDDGLVRLFPIPSALVAASSVRTKQEDTLASGATDIVVSGPLPSSEALVDVYLGGVWQNSDQWSIINTTTIRMVGAQYVDLEAEVVFFPTAADATATKTFEYIITGTAGQTDFITPRPYAVGASALSIKVNGVSYAPSAVTETSATTFQIAALASDSEIEVVILESRSTYDVTLRATMMPTEMVNDSDEPDIPQGFEHFHDGIWQWALFECYSKDGQTKRMDLTEFYLGRYGGTIREYKDAYPTVFAMQPLDAWRV